MNPVKPGKQNQPFTLPLFEEGERWLAFDLEIAKVLPEDFGELKQFRPLGISCAATLCSGEEPLLWTEQDARGGYARQLLPATAARLVEYLQERSTAGYRIVTWNGLGFDFDVLYEESGWLPACKTLALEHTDMMFHIFCEKGYALSLDKAARGMGLAGKMEGMDGALAPSLWQEGQQERVLEYLQQDARITLQLAQEGQRQRVLRWVSTTLKLQELKLPRGWLPVKDARNLPLPDTTWMRDPWSRHKFTGWLDD